MTAPVIAVNTLHLVLPYYGCVSAGFPSPADDYIVDRIDITDYLIGNAEGTYQVGSGRQDQEAVDFFTEHVPYILRWWS